VKPAFQIGARHSYDALAHDRAVAFFRCAQRFFRFVSLGDVVKTIDGSNYFAPRVSYWDWVGDDVSAFTSGSLNHYFAIATGTSSPRNARGYRIFFGGHRFAIGIKHPKCATKSLFRVV